MTATIQQRKLSVVSYNMQPRQIAKLVKGFVSGGYHVVRDDEYIQVFLDEGGEEMAKALRIGKGRWVMSAVDGLLTEA